MYIFLHTVNMKVVTVWLWYKRHCRLLVQKPMKLSTFQTMVADSLVNIKRPIGRPSVASPTTPPTCRVIQRPPVSDVRYDGTDHLPEWGTRGRCKNSDCWSLSFIKCVKCDVFLCLNKDRNCFFSFHKKMNRTM